MFLKDNPNVKTMGEMQKKIAHKKSVGASRMGPFMNKGGRVGLKAGSKGCKLAMKGKEELTERIRNENLLLKRWRT